MSDLTSNINELESLTIDLASKQDEFQKAFDSLTSSGGKGNISQLTNDLQAKALARDQSVEASILSINKSKKVLILTANIGRKQGLLFDPHQAESISTNSLTATDIPEIIRVIRIIKEGLGELDQKQQTFETLKKDITDNIKRAKSLYQELENLEILEELDRTNYDKLIIGKNRTKSLEDMNKEIISLLEGWQKKINETYVIKDQSAIADLERSMERLIQLDGATDEDMKIFDEIKDLRGSGPNPTTLLRIKDASLRFNSRADQLSVEISDEINKLYGQAENTFKSIHPAMPEALELMSIIATYNLLKEQDLISYRKNIKAGIDHASNAGSAAIERFQNTCLTNPDYVIQNVEEAEILGTAIKLISPFKEQYRGPLWLVAWEIMFRIDMASLEKFNSQDFYEFYGYPAISQSFESAAEKKDFLPLLSLFLSQFSPPGYEFNREGILHFLSDTPVNASFKLVLNSNALIVNKNSLQSLSPNEYGVMLCILSVGRELGLPLAIRLQWAALLHDLFPLKSQQHHEISRFLLDALLDSGQYLSLYYSLQALNIYYDDLWIKPDYQPMIFHITTQAIQLDSLDISFLVDLSKNPSIEKLAAGDFSYEFLLASLAHYLTTQKGANLINTAWDAWDNWSSKYPELTDILHRELQGEQFSSTAVADYKKMKQEYQELLSDLNQRMVVSTNNHPVTYFSQNWYIDNFFRPWIGLLSKPDLTNVDLIKINDQIVRIRQQGDLLDYSNPNYHTKTGQRGQSILPGSLRKKFNQKTSGLIDRFDKLIRIQRQLGNSNNGLKIIQIQPLHQELGQIIEQSIVTKWAVKNLLCSCIPFLNSVIEE